MGISQQTLDAVLGNYGNRPLEPAQPPLPVNRATLLAWDEDTVGLEVSETQIQQRLVQCSYLAFAALACRRFGSTFEYHNADTHLVIGQRFDTNNPSHACITTRRRDGGSMNMLATTGGPKFVRPYHVDNNARVPLDTALLEALCRLPEGDLKQRIDDSIVAYLRANTDSPLVDQRSELILMRVAIDTLLDAAHDKPAFRRAITAHFDELPTPPLWHQGDLSEDVWREHWNNHVVRPLDAWVHDVCAARNAAAHGTAGGHTGSLWSRANHLIFLSWLIPLILKKLLAQEGLYVLTDEDRLARAGFEVFLAHDLLARTDQHEDKIWWQHAESVLLQPLFAQRLIAAVAGEEGF